MNNKLIRRRLHDLVPYCHRRYIEDTPVIIPMLWYANKVVYTNNVGYYYRLNPNSLTHTADDVKTAIYKGLAFCDMNDFFEAMDPEVFNRIPLKNAVTQCLDIFNRHPIESVKCYEKDFIELMLRLNKALTIDQVAFRKKK